MTAPDWNVKTDAAVVDNARDFGAELDTERTPTGLKVFLVVAAVLVGLGLAYLADRALSPIAASDDRPAYSTAADIPPGGPVQLSPAPLPRSDARIPQSLLLVHSRPDGERAMSETPNRVPEAAEQIVLSGLRATVGEPLEDIAQDITVDLARAGWLHDPKRVAALEAVADKARFVAGYAHSAKPHQLLIDALDVLDEGGAGS